MDLVTSSTIARAFESLRDVGLLEAVTGGVFAIGIGVAYIMIRNGFITGEAGQWRSLVAIGPRIALGAIFFIMGGLNGLYQLAPDHPSSLRESCDACAPFLDGILSTGYLFPLIKGVELMAGALLLIGLWVPLATLILSPIVLNIALYHLFLNPAGLLIGVLILVLHIVVAWQQRSAFRPLLSARARLVKHTGAGVRPTIAESS